MLINKICPMCKKNAFLRINSDQKKEFKSYACYGGLIQEKLKSFNDFEREFVKTGYCPECQEDFMSCVSMRTPPGIRRAWIREIPRLSGSVVIRAAAFPAAARNRI